jgi:hypothetical protein
MQNIIKYKINKYPHRAWVTCDLAMAKIGLSFHVTKPNPIPITNHIS